MYDEQLRRANAESPDAQRVYALLLKLGADLRRLEALTRAVKKQLEEQKKT